MRTIKTWLATIAVLLCSITVSAYNFKVDGIYYNITDATNLTVSVTLSGIPPSMGASSGNGDYYGSFKIPETVTYEGKIYQVTSIGQYAFWDCTNLYSVIIPECITSIGKGAFDGCIRLNSISIPQSVTAIESSIFSNCSNLSSIDIPSSVTSIGSYAFSGCGKLSSITIPQSVTSIGNCAFYYCTGLKEIIFEDGNKDLSLGYLSNSTNSYDGDIFNSHSVETLYLGRNLVCSSSPFSGNDKLNSIKIGKEVKSINWHAFSRCSALAEIIIPENVTSIEGYAFYNCSNLSSITIPESVISIGESAFDNTLWYDNLNDGSIYINNVFYQYKGTMPENTSLVVKEGTISISSFQGCEGLVSITIPESVARIEDWAFSHCTNLIAVTIPENGAPANPCVYA